MEYNLYSLTLLFHSAIRYFVLIAMLVSLFRAARGWFGGAAFEKTDEKLSVWLLIMAHTQLLLGFILYFVSPRVTFEMKDNVSRYWSVEHITMMVVAILLMTLSRIMSKRTVDAVGKHKRVFLYNAFALLLIVMAIAQSKRGFFSLPDVM